MFIYSIEVDHVGRRLPPEYAELYCLSNFSFLHGASHAQELVARAVQLGYRALAITDECSLAGVVRAHAAAKRADFPLIIGAHFHLTQADGRPALSLLALVQNREGVWQLVGTDHHGAHAGGQGTLFADAGRFHRAIVRVCPFAGLARLPDDLAAQLSGPAGDAGRTGAVDGGHLWQCAQLGGIESVAAGTG